MSDDLDDDMSIDDSFDDFDKKEETLGDLVRENPLLKVGAVVGAAVLIFVVISMFGGGEGPVHQSRVGDAPDITATPGTDEASPAYVQAIQEINEADIERAMAEGDSSLPVPIEPPVGIISLPEEAEAEEDPLQRWRRLQEERLEREIQQREESNVLLQDDTNNTDVSRQEAIQALSSAMAQQMSSILGTDKSTQISSQSLTNPDFLAKLHEQEKREAEEALLEGEDLSAEVVGEVLLPAGKIVYAQLLTEANTDVPGPILAEIMSGPLKGSRILGTFEAQDEFLTLNFDTIVYEEESLSIDAVALDPETTLPGMATEVDHRYFKRIILPAAASFVQGMAEAIAESGRTTVTIQGETVAESEEAADNEQEVATGVQEVGDKLSEILDEMASETEVLIRIASGTPIGILFLEPVTKDNDVVESEDSDL